MAFDIREVAELAVRRDTPGDIIDRLGKYVAHYVTMERELEVARIQVDQLRETVREQAAELTQHVARIRELGNELAWLRYFYTWADFGPASGDVVAHMKSEYMRTTGNDIPENYKDCGDE